MDDAGDKSSQRFRISLSHWLWWLTITALLLAVHREDMADRSPLSLRSNPTLAAQYRLFWTLQGAANLAVVPFHAIAICTLGLATWRLRRLQYDFPVYPGHWLLVCLGANILSHEIAWLIWKYIVLPRWDNPELSPQELEPLWLLNHLLLETLSFVIALLVLVVADCRIQAVIRWRAVF